MADSKPSPSEQEEDSASEAGLAEQLERVTRERDDAIAKLQRATADYQNLRRRQQADLENSLRRGLEQLLTSLLLVLDHLELALAAPAENEETKNFARGVALTRNSLLKLLEQEGVEPIAADDKFDPAKHHAVATVERDDVPPGTI